MLKTYFTKSILFLALTASVLVGCDKDKDSKSCKLTSISGVGEDESFTGTFTYDGSRITGQSNTYVDAGGSETITVTFVYGANGNITEFNSGVYKIKYIYNSNNEIIKSEEYEGTLLVDQEEYEYTNGRITKAQYYEITSTGFVKDDYEIFEYASASGNSPNKITYHLKSGTVSSTTTYEYDNKKSPIASFAALMKIYALNGNGSENNITKETYSYPGSANASVTTYVHQFNGDGLLTQTTETTVQGADTSTETITYGYSCN